MDANLRWYAVNYTVLFLLVLIVSRIDAFVRGNVKKRGKGKGSLIALYHAFCVGAISEQMGALFNVFLSCTLSWSWYWYEISIMEGTAPSPLLPAVFDLLPTSTQSIPLLPNTQILANCLICLSPSKIENCSDYITLLFLSG